MRTFLGICIIVPVLAWGQLGGQSAFQSLNLTTNPRTAALGGTSISLADGDVSQYFENPATLDSIGSGNIFFHFNPYFTDVFVYSLAYSFNIKNMEGFAAGLHFVNYGDFTLTDETGQVLGDFSANDYMISIGKSHQLGPFVLGLNLKFVNSSIESYSSSAILADIGGIFRINRNWTASMVFENMGGRISNYTNFNAPPIPFDVKLGTSFKPEYMPFRFTLTTTNLVNDNASIDHEETGRSTNAFDDILKRVNLGAELLLSDNFQLLFGYNHKRRQELRLDETGGGAGFSYGLMVRVKRIQLRFSRATYHTAGGSSFISIQTNFNDFKKIL